MKLSNCLVKKVKRDPKTFPSWFNISCRKAKTNIQQFHNNDCVDNDVDNNDVDNDGVDNNDNDVDTHPY